MVAVAVFSVSVVAVVLAGAWADTLGYDFLAYDGAARRLLDGGPLYDTSYEAAGGFGLYFYPPPFVLAVLPLAAVAPPGLAVWLWTAGLVGALLAGIALLPVRSSIRWVVLALAGVFWPVVYSIKLGQVGPILFLLFALGWRRLASDRALGLVAALGALVKLQPGLLLCWALLRRRWGALVVGAIGVLAVSAAATPLVGPAAWGDFLTLLARVSDPITTPGNATIGALAHRAGLDRAAAAGLQWLSVALVGVAWLVATLRRPPVVGYLATVLASQLVSPILWDHYAMLLLLPVAWLLDRGRWWAALLVLAAPWPLVAVVPPAVYPAALVVALVGLLVSRASGSAPVRPSAAS